MGELLQPWLDTIGMWYQNLPEGLVIGVLGSLIATLFVTLLAKTRQIPGQIVAGLLSTRKRSQTRLEHALQQYRARLDSAIFRIHHSWMKEGQTLEDILVPVFVDAQDGGGVENLPLVLSQAFAIRPIMVPHALWYLVVLAPAKASLYDSQQGSHGH